MCWRSHTRAHCQIAVVAICIHACLAEWLWLAGSSEFGPSVCHTLPSARPSTCLTHAWCMPSMPRAFPSAWQVLQVAHERFSLSIDAPLEEAIAQHLGCKYSNGPCAPGSAAACTRCEQRRKQNGGLAVNLVERAFKRLADRVVRCAVPRNSPALTQLVAEDFEIGTAQAQHLRQYDTQEAARLTIAAQVRVHMCSFVHAQCTCARICVCRPRFNRS